MSRGQTTIDFAVGAGVFVLAVAFAVAFVPGMMQPFSADQDGTLVADRAASQLSSNLLGAPETPHVLDERCTDGFFDADGSVPAGCRYAADGADLRGALGIDATKRVNVTIERDGGVEFAAGDAAPTGAESVVVAQRSVLLDGDRRSLYVRVW